MKQNNDIIDHILQFLNSIQIQVVEQKGTDDTFLPGLHIKSNTLFLDRDKLKYPGDLLHEAGHMAVAEEKNRILIGTEDQDKNWPTDGEEIATLLWSYAASCHLKINPKIVFHENGYKGDSNWLVAQYTGQNYIGLPLLEWMGLSSPKDFPRMKKWVR